MNIERLQKMAEMLKEVEAGTWKPTDIESIPFQWGEAVIESGISFDMATWGGPFDDVGNTVSLHYGSDPADACGFAACAVGHALLDDRFEDLINADYDGSQPRYEKHSSWEAVITYFDIDGDIARHLFDDENYQNEPEDDEQQWDLEPVRVTPAMVRERIELLISGEPTDGKA